MELSVKDFQGWKDATISLGGLTVVVGPSSRGKSALSRALKGILRNTVSEGQIRLGAKETRVSLSLDDHEVECSRVLKGSSSYVVDGAEFGKLGGEVPPPMLTWGHQPVEVNGVKVDPIFAGQFDSQFLLSSSPAETSAILNAFASTERLDKGRKVLKGYTQEVDAEAKVLGGQVSALQEEVAQNAVLAERAEVLRAQIAEQMTKARTLTSMTKALEALSTAVARRRTIDARLAVLAGVDAAIAPVAPLARAADLRANLVGVVARRTTALDRIHALEGIESVVDTALKGYLRLDRIVRVESDVQRGRGLKSRITSMERVVDAEAKTLKTYAILVRLRALLVNDPAPLKARAASVQDLTAKVDPVQQALKRVQSALRASEAVAAATLARENLSLTQKDAEQALADIQSAESEISAWRRANHLVTCPKCFHEFTPAEESHE